MNSPMDLVKEAVAVAVEEEVADRARDLREKLRDAFVRMGLPPTDDRIDAMVGTARSRFRAAAERRVLQNLVQVLRTSKD